MIFSTCARLTTGCQAPHSQSSPGINVIYMCRELVVMAWCGLRGPLLSSLLDFLTHVPPSVGPTDAHSA
jgi:hypothetical protein